MELAGSEAGQGAVMNTFTRTIPAIPTRYNAVNFRSRLEAKWAYFFDLLEWRWDYEPIDLNGWIPDFALYGPKNTTLVEVKPAFDFPQDIADEIDKAYPKSESSHEVLIVGARLCKEDSFLGPGWIRDDWDSSWGPTCFLRWHPAKKDEMMSELGSGLFGFCHSYNSFVDRITGNYDGSCCLEHPEELIDIWRQAGNYVQWRGRR